MKEDIHVRIDGAVMRDVRAYAKANGLSLAAAASLLLRWGLWTASAAAGDPS